MDAEPVAAEADVKPKRDISGVAKQNHLIHNSLRLSTLYLSEFKFSSRISIKIKSGKILENKSECFIENDCEFQ